MEAAEELELHEVHHGIAAAESPQVMRWLADHNICLNVCPTSNVMLGRTEDYSTHPVRALYDAGVPVTINSDDMLIFNQSVSEEYLNLYSSGLMSANELNDIRETGLRR
ncbi:Aminodeoxyfutalosine deaminase [compost metagenome]